MGKKASNPRPFKCGITSDTCGYHKDKLCILPNELKCCYRDKIVKPTPPQAPPARATGIPLEELQSHHAALPILIDFIKELSVGDYGKKADRNEIRRKARETLRQWDKER